MWLPAQGNLPVSFTFAALYGMTAVGAIGKLALVLRVKFGVLSADMWTLIRNFASGACGSPRSCQAVYDCWALLYL